MARIFLCSNYALFSKGLESLLNQEPRLKIVGQDTDQETALGQIKMLQPDVVILDCSNLKYDSTSTVLRILREQERLTIIVLNLRNNVICIYRGEQRVITEVKDLVEAIQYATAHITTTR